MFKIRIYLLLAALATAFMFYSCEEIPADDVTFINECGEDIMVCCSNNTEKANLTVEFAFSKKGESVWIENDCSHTYPRFASTMFNDDDTRCYHFLIIRKSAYEKYGKDFLIEKNRYNRKLTYSYSELKKMGFHVIYKDKN